jgi:hypothetical protein
VAVALTVKNNVYFVIVHHLGICELVNFPERLSWPRRMSTRVNRTGQPLLEQEQNELGCSVFRRIDLRDEIGL